MMGVQQLPIPGSDITIPFCQYQINDRQQFVVLAINFDKQIFSLGDHDGIEYTRMGKLNEQSTIFELQVINSLRIDQWDFDKYPNPEIVLIQPAEENDEDTDDVEILSPEEDLFDDEEEEPIKCRQCGCSENDPCIHQQYGPCWWIEEDLCSHCKNWPGESTRPNSIML